MRGNARSPNDQAEVVLYEPFVEYLLELTERGREEVLADVCSLCLCPAGTHPLGNKDKQDRLADLNTLHTLGKEHRIVFASRVVNGVGVLEVLCGGPRKASAVHDIANMLAKTGKLTKDEVTQLWDALELLEIVAEDIGVDGWDYAPPVARKHLVDIVVKLGILERDVASTLSGPEIQAAMEAGFNELGEPTPAAALTAAMNRARTRASYTDASVILRSRLAPRCGAWMPRAKAPCTRCEGHPGAHRSQP